MQCFNPDDDLMSLQIQFEESMTQRGAEKYLRDVSKAVQAGREEGTAYGQAKLANVLMANELQRRYGEKGLGACSLHPGTLITTDIGRNSVWMKVLMQLISPFTKSPNQGAATSVYCATEADTGKVAGLYFQDCQPVRMSREAQDAEVAGKLWDVSESWADQLLSSQQ